MMMPVGPGALARLRRSPALAARASARRAAARAGITIRPLTSLDDVRSTEALLTDVWRPGDGVPPLSLDLIRALAGAGNYAVGAYVDTTLIGACVGFWGSPERPNLHSHIAGVADGYRGRQVGFALKLDQRAYALEQGVDTITWTFDPLVARNAHLNLRRLCARPVEYRVDYYGAMVDGVNGSDESDRFLVRWELAADATMLACDLEEPARARQAPPASPALSIGDVGEPRTHKSVGTPLVTVAVPADIERLRRDDPRLAHAWRAAVRTVVTDLLEGGAGVVDFDRSRSHYLMQPGAR